MLKFTFFFKWFFLKLHIFFLITDTYFIFEITSNAYSNNTNYLSSIFIVCCYQKINTKYMASNIRL